MSERAPGSHVGAKNDNTDDAENIQRATTDSAAREPWTPPLCRVQPLSEPGRSPGCLTHKGRGSLAATLSLWPWESLEHSGTLLFLSAGLAAPSSQAV